MGVIVILMLDLWFAGDNRFLNPDCAFEVHNMDITKDENSQKFKDSLATGSLDRKGPVNLVIGCVDNMEARQALENVMEELQMPYLDAVVSDDAMSGAVQLIIPGRTGGLEASPIKSHMAKQPGTCAASLPTTDSIIAGLTAQNALKYLLGFGEVAFLISYNAVTNDFTTRMTYPDPRKLGPGGASTPGVATPGAY